MDTVLKKQQSPPSQPFLGISLNLVETSKLHSVVNTIFDYKALANIDLSHQIRSLSEVTKEIMEKYPELRERPVKVKECIQQNYQLLHAIIDKIKKPLQYENNHYHYSRHNLFKMFDIIIREWSEQGHTSRKSIKTLQSLLSKYYPSQTISPKQLLITGGPLGRLLLQLSPSYLLNANQQDFDQFLITHYFLNISHQPHTIYPHIHSFSNHISQSHVFTPYTVPDASIPTDIAQQIGISLGSFDWIYRYQTGMWECVVVWGGLERGNPVRVIKRGCECLRSGGILVVVTGLGLGESGVELGYEDMISVGKELGMRVLEEREESQEGVKGEEGRMMRSQSMLYFIVFEKI